MPIRIGSIPKWRLVDVGGVGAEQDEGRLRDVGDVEHAERDRHPDADRGVKAAEQDAGDDRVDEKFEHRGRRGPAALAAAARARQQGRRDLVARGRSPHAGFPLGARSAVPIEHLGALDQHRRLLLSATRARIAVLRRGPTAHLARRLRWRLPFDAAARSAAAAVQTLTGSACLVRARSRAKAAASGP